MSFGRLEVLRLAGIAKGGNAQWECRCECGTETLALACNLKSGNVQSCGCLQPVFPTKHGKSVGETRRAYKVWAAMMDRCNKPDHPSYTRYGARGITVCERWHDVECFIADMGLPPAGMSLDRIDNDDGYHRDNCRWATRTQQANNRGLTRRITFDGRTMSMTQWAKELGLPKSTLFNRLNRGASIEEAFRRR